jgi:hypothetical protein
MPLTEKTNNTLIYILRKAGEYGAIFLAAWQLGLPALNNHIDNQIGHYNKEHSGSKKSFREAFAEKIDIDPDEVVIEFSKWYNSTEEFRDDFYNVLPHIQEEMDAVTPRLVILNDREFWVAADGDYYRVSRDNELGIGYYYLQGSWREIFK